ncbi:MAG: NYN domain-containing protein [Calothrix sp. MO_192.B10]|nr:NYN domain-containing protein [Calothrix sp. MO_192.B10]
MECSRTIYDSALLNQIGSHVCQTIIFIQEQQPELLIEKYRNIPWHSSRNQLNLKAKLIKVLSEASDWQTLLKQLRRLLKALLISESFDSPILVTLLAKINRLNPHKEDKLNSSTALNNGYDHVPDKMDHDYQSLVSISRISSGVQSRIAILLLDAENLQLNLETEQFLSQVSNFPLQVKIAFANWQAMGKKDNEFHQRGYDLIHVPAGKDNADGKMIAFGASIQEHYPQVQEVFVCSCDRVMINLCNHLQKNGIVVYQVSQKGSNIEVLNTQNNQVQVHTIVPSLEKFLHQIKEIITAEATRTANQWVKLSRISKLFYQKSRLDINQVVSHHIPGKTAKVFFEETADFALHKVPEDSNIYVALFKMPHSSKIKFKNKSDLEKALAKIVNTLVTKTSKNYIPIETLSSKFNQQHGQPVSKVMERLNLDANFLGFLHSCNSFILEKVSDRWQVTLK